MDNKVRVYFIAVYFIMQTVTTVGYGDVNPTNTKERIFLICLMLVGVVAFSFIAGGLTSIIQALDEKNSEDSAVEAKLMLLRERHDFNDNLYIKIRKQVAEGVGSKEEDTLDTNWLVDNLKDEVKENTCVVVFKNFNDFPFFKKYDHSRYCEGEEVCGQTCYERK